MLSLKSNAKSPTRHSWFFAAVAEWNLQIRDEILVFQDGYWFKVRLSIRSFFKEI
ncbi:MAG: hypothetical protein IGS39_09510 [Calothrix sp. C42_A2020_038]|nr:hypothetical protein [Calothrix sp. C42_A2020_038]